MEPAPQGWWYRPNADHVRYWLNHSLPVLIVLVDVAAERCYWQLVNETTLVETSGQSWKVLIPEQHVLDASARETLRDAAEGDLYLLRVRALALDRPWMQLLAERKRVVIEMEEWINKTSGRGSITLGVDNEDGKAPAPLAQWAFLRGPTDYGEAIPRLFPWAEVCLHEETYEEADRDLYETECVVWDEDDRVYIQEFDEWMQSRQLAKLRPYRNQAGEVDLWRLELNLNELGKAFLIVDRFAAGAGEGGQEQPE